MIQILCFLAVVAVSGASDGAVIIGEQLPLGHTFGGLGFGWNNALLALPKHNGWAHSYPSHSYSYFSGSGWGSAPIYKEVPVALNPGWGQAAPLPIYNAGWGQAAPLPISNAGWGQAAPLPIYNAGWAKAAPVINDGWGKALPIYNGGWGQSDPNDGWVRAVTVRKTHNTGWGKSAPVPIAYDAGWGKSAHVPITYNAGWEQEVPIAHHNYGYGWNTAHAPAYGYGYGTYAKGNGWGQALPLVAVKSVGIAQGIPLLKHYGVNNGWAAPRYAGGWGTPDLSGLTSVLYK